ncbi:DNA cytosine methyltransferase [Streptomyces sp. NPDC058405]|uniref:DNA cytosine methyltransferase n=1 Tax=Streptomyces sp. NPDC058405 TaxID=3346482 RepID=UPI003664EC1B
MIRPDDDLPRVPGLTSIEICAGAGGQALGLERAGFVPTVLVELDADAVGTLRSNRPHWNVLPADVRRLAASDLCEDGQGVGLLAAGVPCPPFSLAGRQLGAEDERDLFPNVLSLSAALRPKAVMVENVKGILQAKFASYRSAVLQELAAQGYRTSWRLLRACDYGVPQLRPRAILIAIRPEAFAAFRWPEPTTCSETAPSVGSVLYESMASLGWELARQWADGAARIAPTLCGGSRKHGGADLGPSRARSVWAQLGVNGSSVADEPPVPGTPMPVRLTVAQMALLQGFPPHWQFSGQKTSAYRQVGNAFPPPVAEAVGRSLAHALAQADITPAEDGIPHTNPTWSEPSGNSLLPGPARKPGVNA